MNPDERSQVLRWLVDKRSSKKRLPTAALEHPVETSQLVLHEFRDRVNRQAGTLQVGRVVALLSGLQVPHASRALAVIWLWPRLSGPGYCSEVVRNAGADSLETLWLRLFQEGSRPAQGHEREQGLAAAKPELNLTGFTAGRETWLRFFQGILLEHAMVSALRVEEQQWALLLPRLERPVVWSRYQEENLTDVLYGPLPAGSVSELTLPDDAERCRVGEFEFWRVAKKRQVRAPLRVGVCHPASLSVARRKQLSAAITSEPFEQVQRAVFQPSVELRDHRLLKSFRSQDIEAVRLFSFLRQRGWRRGVTMDFGTFFELYAEMPGLDWRVFVRFFPGIPASGPQTGRQYLHSVGFQPSSAHGPLWGWHFGIHAGLLVNGQRVGVIHYGDAPSDLEFFLRTSRPIDFMGEELGAVPPLVYSETLRTLSLMMQAYGLPCEHPFNNSTRFFEP